MKGLRARESSQISLFLNDSIVFTIQLSPQIAYKFYLLRFHYGAILIVDHLNITSLDSFITSHSLRHDVKKVYDVPFH